MLWVGATGAAVGVGASAPDADGAAGAGVGTGVATCVGAGIPELETDEPVDEPELLYEEVAWVLTGACVVLLELVVAVEP
jgi:hypothetical protein